MRRLALVLLVGLLTVTVSGAIELLVPEPCTLDEASNADGRCPPTCATCVCCAQPVVATSLVIVTPQLVALHETPAIESRLIASKPGEIFHVPRRLVS